MTRRSNRSYRANLTALPNAARYDRPSELPSPPTTCPEYDETHRLLTEARTKRHANREATSQVEREIRRADERYLIEAAEDIRAGKDPRKDPRDALSKRRERLVAEGAILKQVQNDRADELDAVVEAHEAAWLERERAKRADLAAQAAEALEQFVSILDEVRNVSALISWLNGGKLHATPIGTREINALRQAVDEIVNPPQTIYVTQAEHRKLVKGEAARDLDGNKITPADCENAYVKITHSPGGKLLESPLGSAGDRV